MKQVAKFIINFLFFIFVSCMILIIFIISHSIYFSTCPVKIYSFKNEVVDVKKLKNPVCFLYWDPVSKNLTYLIKFIKLLKSKKLPFFLIINCSDSNCYLQAKDLLKKSNLNEHFCYFDKDNDFYNSNIIYGSPCFIFIDSNSIKHYVDEVVLNYLLE